MNQLNMLEENLSTFDGVIEDLNRLRLQLMVVEAQIRKVSPTHANVLSDICDETDGIIRRISYPTVR